MVYKTFLDTVKTRMEQNLGRDYELVFRKIPKNNGLTLDGLCISKCGANVAPAIYLAPFYRQYKDGRLLNDIVDELLTQYRQWGCPPGPDFDILTSYELLKPDILCKLIHASSNEALLEQIPHVPWMDLALVFYICLKEDHSGIMTALIHNEHLNIWNISLEELKHTAMENTPRRFPPVIATMASIIEEIDSRLVFEGCEPLSPEQSAPFYVLSNTAGINGAACILYENIIKNFAEEMGRDIVILPSSIHEVLLLPDEEDLSYEEMSRLVTHINQSEVPREDRLSNQIYLYSRSCGEILPVSHSSTSIC